MFLPVRNVSIFEAQCGTNSFASLLVENEGPHVSTRLFGFMVCGLETVSMGRLILYAEQSDR